MTVAALVLGIIGTVLAAGSAVWNIAQYLLSGARPKLTPIIGTDYGGSTVPFDATSDVRPTLLQLEGQHDVDAADRIIGVTVVNKGRADLCVTRWSLRVLPVTRSSLRVLPVTRWMFRALPVGPVFIPPTDPGCPDLPCTIPPGGEAPSSPSSTASAIWRRPVKRSSPADRSASSPA
jgi:hypothetical protein